MSGIPVLWPRLDCQFYGRRMRPTEGLEMTDVDLANELEAAFGRFFEVLPEHVPMFGKWDDREAAD